MQNFKRVAHGKGFVAVRTPSGQYPLSNLLLQAMTACVLLDYLQTAACSNSAVHCICNFLLVIDHCLEKRKLDGVGDQVVDHPRCFGGQHPMWFWPYLWMVQIL